MFGFFFFFFLNCYSLCNLISIGIPFPILFSSCIVSLRGNFKLYYIIEYNIFLLFVGFFFYFGRFFILSTLEFVSY